MARGEGDGTDVPEKISALLITKRISLSDQLYHEATLANLLETVLYHEAAAEAAEESMLDLGDYCYRKLSQLLARYWDKI